jgi:hypothetical protein
VRRASLLLLLAVLFVTGCGQNARQKYAARADAVCKKYKAKTDALTRPTDLPGFARTATQTLAILRSARTELRRLQPPADERRAAEAWLNQFDVLIRDVELLRDNAKADKAAAVQRIAQTSLRDNARANRLGRQLGMKACSTD